MEENKHWNAKWIWTEGLPRTASTGNHELAYFRRDFTVPASISCRLTVHVTADSRYRLFLNGESVAIGPCKGDSQTYYYETIDLTDRLKTGKNVLAAQVLHYTPAEPFVMGAGGPISIWRSGSGAFWLEGCLCTELGEKIADLCTDEKWRCLKGESLAFNPSALFQWLGGLEKVDGKKVPHGWQQISFPDESWKFAVPFYEAKNNFGELTPWQLASRPIPFLYERDTAFRNIVRTDGIVADQAAASLLDQTQEAGITIPAHERVFIEFDAGELTTGYLQLAITGGRGTEVRILCAECYEDEKSALRKRLKGVRDDYKNGKLVGEYDVYLVAGAGGYQGMEREIYEPFWFRTFRFVRLEIETGDEPITVNRFSYRETGYPLEIRSEFSCSDSDFNQLWQLSVNTLRRCMHETYEDCPYYEQLQYTMDTRLQMLFTYNLSGDDRLARKAIYDFHSSLLPSGMLQCRYPSVYRQVIPAFSLYWIHMLHDHYCYFADLDLIKRYRPTLLALLDWFERQLTPEDLVGETPNAYWTHFDWVNEWPLGAPPAKVKGPVTLLSLMYAVALHKAALLLEATDWREIGNECREKAQRVNQAIIKHCWSPEQQLFRDGPEAEEYSQHPQIWGVLSGAVEGDIARDLLRRTLTDPTLPRVSLPMSYFLFRALEETGLYAESFVHWDRWRVLIGQNLTTLPEIAHAVPRSDCHAWSAVPLSEFPAMILGVTPAEPGYKRIRIAPQTGRLSWAKGKVATIHGEVEVEWKIEGEQTFTLRVQGPDRIPLEVHLPDGSFLALDHESSFELSCKMDLLGKDALQEADILNP